MQVVAGGDTHICLLFTLGVQRNPSGESDLFELAMTEVPVKVIGR